MQKIYVPLSDEGHNTLITLAGKLARHTETVASQALETAMRELPLEGRYMIIHGDDLDRLEKIFGSGSVLNSLDLRQKVERLAGITYGNIRLDFSPGQLEEIERRAERLSKTPEELIRMCVRKIEELFFTHVGVGAQG